MIRHTAWALTACISLFSPINEKKLHSLPQKIVLPVRAATPHVQVALLLDVSNSMDGLISQAKDQLWGLLKLVSQVRCGDGQAPAVEVALYEYGRPGNGAENGFAKKIEPFTKDLEQLYSSLYALTTNGGDEYCGYVMQKALDELAWDTAAGSYKTILIAGNESFLQGDVSFTKACETARKKGVIVNTIFCGENKTGIGLNWNLGASCGNGSYTSLDKDAVPQIIPTPYDSALFVLNTKMRNTTIPYGKAPVFDTVYTYNTGSIDKVIGINVVRSDPKKSGYFKSDLVDMVRYDNRLLDRIKAEDLPDSLKGKPHNYLVQLVAQKQAERDQLRKELLELDNQRSAFVAEAKRTGNFPATLLDIIEGIIRKQISRFGFTLAGEKKGF